MDVAVAENPLIGGLFGLPEKPDTNHTPPLFIRENSVLLANARSAIFLACKLLSVRQVWMPSYCCKAVFDAVTASGANASFFAIGGDLSVTSTGWLEQVKKGDMVVLVDYFGFPLSAEIAAAVKDRGAFVLEDASQALLSGHVGEHSDAVVYSPRKLLGVPDGGILNFTDGHQTSDIRLALPPPKWWGKTLGAAVGRSEFDRMGGSRRWFRLFQEAEEECPTGYYGMSSLSMELLRQGFNYRDISRQRVENYRFLAGKFADIALFPELPEGVVPLGFCVRLEKRDQVRELLFQNEVYPPIHWPIADFVPEEFVESHKLAECILTLPCDQRYGSEDMERVAESVLRVIDGSVSAIHAV